MIKYFLLSLTALLISQPAHAADKTIFDMADKKPVKILKIEKLVIETKSGQSIPYDVEIALTKEEQKDGLMNRDTLAPQSGMLFLFDKVGRPQFWMKDTNFSLDLIYIGTDGTITGIHPMAIAYDSTPIKAPADCIAVLEIAGKSAQKLGISVGDKVNHRFFKKDAK